MKKMSMMIVALLAIIIASLADDSASSVLQVGVENGGSAGVSLSSTSTSDIDLYNGLLFWIKEQNSIEGDKERKTTYPLSKVFDGSFDNVLQGAVIPELSSEIGYTFSCAFKVGELNCVNRIAYVGSCRNLFLNENNELCMALLKSGGALGALKVTTFRVEKANTWYTVLVRVTQGTSGAAIYAGERGGELRCVATYADSVGSSVGNSNIKMAHFRLGSCLYPSSGFLQSGQFANIRFWTRALTDRECECVDTYAGISISDVEVFSGYPWQEVVIGYKITGVADRTIGGLEVSARDNGTGRVYECKTLDGVDFTPGYHVIKWNASADGAKFKSDDVDVTVRIVEPPQYCEIDLSCGTAASMYPVVELADAPSDGWTDEYKTAKLVLRRVDAGSFKMLGQYDVVLTKPFYIGVFEVTQYQWELVMGDRPSYFCNDSYYAARPVEQVSYDMIRGNSAGAGWPANNAVDETSFLGRMRKKTGLDFDLPTEAEWEYACRAGTTTSFNNGADDVGLYQDSNMNILGRYWYNGGYDGRGRPQSSDAAGTATVGSYQPNAWGLYDMHGNVGEWCLDWDGSVGSAVDPRGKSSGYERVTRGGTWMGGGDGSTVNARARSEPFNVSNYRGLRLALTLQVDGSPVRFDGNFATIATASSGRVAIDTTFTDGTGVGNSISLTYGSVGGTDYRVLSDGAEVVNSAGNGKMLWTLPNSGANKLLYSGAVTMESVVSVDYLIVFNVNGADVSVAAVSRREGFPYGALPIIMRKGYEFLGWFTEPDGGEQVTADTIVDSSRTLYAHWERYAYDFKWLGGGKLDICSGMRRTCEPQGIAMDSAWGNGGARAVVSVDGVEKAESRGVDEFVWSGDETKEYTLKHQVYDAQGRTVGEPYTAKIAWTSRAVVTFDGGNGDEAFSREYDKSYAYRELPSVTKTGHTFAGWYTAAEGGEKVEAGAQFDGSVSKLYAHWTVNQYGVKFDKNGGEGTAGDLTVAYGDVVPMDGVAFRKSGYRLAGWATAADGAAVYGQGGAMSNLTAEANGSIQLYAVWEPTMVDLKSFKQRYPWNGFVDVECDVGAEGRVGLMLIDEASGTNFTAKTLFCQGGSVTNSALWMAEGPQKFIWDAGSDLPDGFKTSKLKAKTYFVEGEE